ncbi:acyltransferase family protein [Curtobacterium sp. ISL-83]|uniref:acyltransferase family protein n=1 Tax=Curtobacterium sp. ISL-83 TaxID=2819145 RepID=UPI001BEC2F89|nr:acyltransferase family protein [Curtobacterium sp. ISL-83]MBT2502611.1 acyltransferase [Curtobacterium sp. ISL-83]
MQTFRPDIEGLRALAIGAVLVNHTFGVPQGGWTGVDVFFVISGFLVTRGLLTERIATGRFDYPSFIARRARRLMPTAVVVVVVVVAAANVLWFRPRAIAVGLDGVASLLSVQNWHLIATGTSYFAAEGPASPLQHFWSLSVEEQFYAVWPLTVVFALLAGRRWWSPRQCVIALSVAVVIVSAMWGVFRSGSSATYFDPVGRAWEFAIGGLVAALGLRLPERLASIVWSGGFALLAWGFVGAASATTSPFPDALPAVAGAACIVVSGGDAAARLTTVLTNQPVRAIGRISYSLYLWHLPVIVFADAVLPASSWTSAVTFTVTFALAAASYRWVERRFTARRPGRRRAPDARSRPTMRGRKAGRAPTVARTAALGFLPLLVLAGSVQINSSVFTDPADAGSVLGLAAPTAAAPPVPYPAIRAGLLEQPSIGGVARALDAGFTNQFAPEMSSSDGCRNELNRPPREARVCTYGPSGADRSALVIGDSIAMSWMPAVRTALVPRGWRVSAIGFASCAATDVGRTPTRSGDALCAAARERMLDEVRDLQPDVVIVANDDQAFIRTIESSLDRATRSWADSTQRLVRELEESADRVVFLGAPPAGLSPQACANRVTGVRSCASTPTAENAALVSAMEQAVAPEPSARYVDVRRWFCVDGQCPVMAGPVLVRVDDKHLTNAYSQRLGEVMAAVLIR